MYTLNFSATNKAALYQELLPQIRSIIADEPNLTANLANTAAVLKEAFGWLWIGFYLVDGSNNTLVLGPFQGPLACTRIPHGRGVCGQAWATGETIVVADVHAHPDHVACSSLSQSEIVVPLYDGNGNCIGVLDADAAQTAQFDETDAEYLGELARILQPLFDRQAV
ncbi:GAF domain-containing protein [Neisseria animalis]|uniref:GAF domain-containing protein n=1 Tax=Neisseria animalis TaxID=492 RepID=A0A5P3MRE6_NEIAN|nr:GAF domain-containing protein [Neisseria animalis]QEY24176.1 GAF domain-containing protein [Neisseria animalis]ROW32215.1 GAF domain-containing protein [Neisseria animalis]VEE06451.1 GAF-domain containing protein [Neisseria animalis]